MTDPTTEAGRALLKGHSIECHTPDGHHRILSDTEGRKVVLAIEAEARAAGAAAATADFAHTIRSHVAGGGWCNHPADLLAKIDQYAILDAPQEEGA